ncbi:GNAT family N-acetyltransferase [Paenibacillus guangzhouensis]|uniref:GNAT family N-acetyltransferase n=1 Tax=Paenibacillus guangzhouensis TaxID=1473112 RepID=UPI0012669BE1|nr:GNAT family N-acetyltransferase [Paenibacillus guangzhouensis]
MAAAPITIDLMQEKYNTPVGRLLVHGFRGKFQHRTPLSDDELALFFEKLLYHYPSEPSSRRIVALLEGEIIGTMSIKWNSNPAIKPIKKKLISLRKYDFLGKWNVCKLFFGLSLLDHKPQVGECYIADVVVHPDHRSKGVGRLLLEWSQQFAQADPKFNRLSLHVAGANPRARQLYEQFSFQTCTQKNSIMRHLMFNELKWIYMVQTLSQKSFREGELR